MGTPSVRIVTIRTRRYPGALENDDYDLDSDCNGSGGWFDAVLAYGGDRHVVPDFDGDGLVDYLASYIWEGHHLTITYGSMEVLNGDWSGQRSAEFGYLNFGEGLVSSQLSTGTTVGDMNGDGVNDAVVTCGFPDVETAALCMIDGTYLTASDGSINPWTIVEGLPRHHEPVHLLSDLDGDGEVDLLVGSDPAWLLNPSPLFEPGFGAQRVERTVHLEYELPDRDGLAYPDAQDDEVKKVNFGLEHEDLDGDGLAELFTVNRYYLGSDLALPGSYGDAEAVFPSEADPSTAGCLTGFAGDVDGDGAPELWFNCMTTGEPGRVTVASWRADTARPVGVIATIDGTPDYPLGEAVGSLGDANVDGLGDLAVALSPEVQVGWGSYGGLFLFRGSDLRVGLEVSMERRFIAGGHTDLTMQDVDGDGDDDLLVSGGEALLMVTAPHILP
jgi:hypothetical protein